MKVNVIEIRNFRRLESVRIDVENDTTVYVGPNNSGKTSASAVFRCFVGPRNFSIHDFAVARIAEIDAFGDENDEKVEHCLPTIDLDIWFSIDPESIEFGRAFTLLPSLSGDFKSVGIHLKYKAKDSAKLRAEYLATFSGIGTGKTRPSLSKYLGTGRNLDRHYDIFYYSLEMAEEGRTETALDNAEGRLLIKQLLRIDFVDAQRSVDDNEANRGSRLSTAFSAFYKKNLEQADHAESAHSIIDENNTRLTDHYKTHFGGLMKVIKGLGVPSINDRDLKIVSSMSPETALQGNTELLYVDSTKNHELPEAYNGLGFKNLIYMAIQISHFHLQWMKTEHDRPICHLIFVEEPEVHLHAQVQQTFVTNIWKIISDAAKEAGDETYVPQFLVTTHSSHILDAVDFEKVRHFQRIECIGEDRNSVKTLNSSNVQNLRNFAPDDLKTEEGVIQSEKALAFLKKYLKQTHCDLFFADAAILVEGTVEKLLLPKMIEKSSPKLRSIYLTILEVGGAYSHRFSSLLKFLNIPYLVITDLDSVNAADRKVCRGDTSGALTSNQSLRQFFGVKTVEDLMKIKPELKVDKKEDRCVVFQTDIRVTVGKSECVMRPRTLEEAFVYQNFDLARTKKLKIGGAMPEALDEAYEATFKGIVSSNFKKTEFALEVLEIDEDWNTPEYIAEGLQWLETRLFTESATVATPVN